MTGGTIASGGLTYRAHREEDIPALCTLWSAASGWGELDEQTWKSWFVDTPFGPCVVPVAVDRDGAIVAQHIYTPSRVSVAGRKVKALRLSAPVLRPDLRLPSMRDPEHPALALSEIGIELAVEGGYSVIYSLPDRGWLPIFRFAARAGLPAYATGTFPCLSATLSSSLKRRDESGGNAVIARPVESWSEEYRELWDAAVENWPLRCGVVRTPEWLQWRNGDQKALEVREADDGSLVGFASFKVGTGLLFDALARSGEELECVLRSAMAWLAAEKGVSKGYVVKVQCTPTIEPVLRRLGFEDEDYSFGFACLSLDPDVPTESIAPDLWYTMPGD